MPPFTRRRDPYWEWEGLNVRRTRIARRVVGTLVVGLSCVILALVLARLPSMLVRLCFDRVDRSSSWLRVRTCSRAAWSSFANCATHSRADREPRRAPLNMNGPATRTTFGSVCERSNGS